MKKLLAATVLGASLTLGSALAQTAVSPEERVKIEGIIKDYLMKNPEILQDVMMELEKKQALEESKARNSIVAENRERIYRSPNQAVIGNPDGRVTLVEFFDYNCGYCKQAMAAKLALMKADPDMRLVVKEYPVLGPASIEAAQVATAFRMQMGDAKYADFHVKLLGQRGQTGKAKAMEVAKELGADMAKLEADLKGDGVRNSLQESLRIGEMLRINGTPSYIVGDEVVVGAVGETRLKAQIAKAKEACGAKPKVC